MKLIEKIMSALSTGKTVKCGIVSKKGKLTEGNLLDKSREEIEDEIKEVTSRFYHYGLMSMSYAPDYIKGSAKLDTNDSIKPIGFVRVESKNDSASIQNWMGKISDVISLYRICCEHADIFGASIHMNDNHSSPWSFEPGEDEDSGHCGEKSIKYYQKLLDGGYIHNDSEVYIVIFEKDIDKVFNESIFVKIYNKLKRM